MTTKLFESRDVSDTITTAVFRDQVPDPKSHCDIEVLVDQDMVVVGGGAGAEELQGGALLTASYPNEQRTGWRASSKDHSVPCPHRLAGFAIGMKVAGLSRDQLLSHLEYSEVSSAPLPHPRATSVPPSPEFMLISGGFHVDWQPYGPGNLATASFPEFGDVWTSASKDHFVVSPAAITTHAICMRKELPVGPPDGQGNPTLKTVNRKVRSITSDADAHPRTGIGLNVDFLTPDPPRAALTGVGAEAQYTGFGSLLWALVPFVFAVSGPWGEGVIASSKDHQAQDISRIKAWVIGIWLG